MTFPTNGRFDTGRKFFNSSTSRLVFFSRGVISASFNLAGNMPDCNDMLTTDVIEGSNSGKYSLIKVAGKGSNWHVFTRDFLMMLRTSSQSSGWKWSKLLLHIVSVMMSDFTSRASADMSSATLILRIFESKYWQKRLAKSFFELWKGRAFEGLEHWKLINKLEHLTWVTSGDLSTVVFSLCFV